MMRVVLIAVGVVVAVGLGVVAAMAVWPESSPGPTFVVDAEVVFSADEPLFARDLGCPDTDGVESPLETAVTRTNSTSVHPGELIGLRYTVDVLAPVTTSSLTLSPTWEADGMTVTSTPACVFRPASESASSGASLTSTGSSTGVPGAELTLTGLGPGDRDVIEVWIVIEEIDQGATFETSVGASGTGSDPVDTPRSLSSRFVPRPTATPEISLSGATDPVRAGETVSYRIRTENPSSTDLVLDVGLEIAVPDALTEVAVSVTDDAEAETPCDLADGGVVCAIGSLEPTEVVEIEVVATVTVSAPTGSGSTGPDCDQTVTVRGRLDPDVCVAATLILDGAATVTREYASDVLPLSLLVLESRPARPVFRNDEPLTFDYLVTTTAVSGLSDPQLFDPLCETLERTITVALEDGDNLLEPGEGWLFTCTAQTAETGIRQPVVAALAENGDRIEADALIEVAVIDPSLAVVVVDSSGVIELVNVGTGALFEPAVSAVTCEGFESLGGDADEDGELGEGERWSFRCLGELDGIVRGYATDELGEPITATN